MIFSLWNLLSIYMLYLAMMPSAQAKAGVGPSQPLPIVGPTQFYS